MEQKIELTPKLGLAVIAIASIFVGVVIQAYNIQAVDAAPSSKKFQVYVTLTGVPANAEDLVVNATILKDGNCCFSSWPEQTVTSPSNGDTVKFVITGPAGLNWDGVVVCGNTFDFSLSSCEVKPLPSKGGSPIRVEYTYPQ